MSGKFLHFLLFWDTVVTIIFIFNSILILFYGNFPISYSVFDIHFSLTVDVMSAVFYFLCYSRTLEKISFLFFYSIISILFLHFYRKHSYLPWILFFSIFNPVYVMSEADLYQNFLRSTSYKWLCIFCYLFISLGP